MVLTHAARKSCIEELLGYYTGSNQEMLGTVHNPSYDKAPKNDDEMSEKESSKQVDLLQVTCGN